MLMAVKKAQTKIITAKKQAAEKQILEEQKILDYKIGEYSLEVIVQKYMLGSRKKHEKEFFIPKSQNGLIWDKKRQSTFIESVMLGLPIPYLFTAVRGEQLEIIDGSQRVQSLVAFFKNELTLEGLKRLERLNGFTYADLPLSRRRRFNKETLRVIELTEKVDADDLFERINPGRQLIPAIEVKDEKEIRNGFSSGAFYDFLIDCAQNEKFLQMCPLSGASEAQRGEFVLRFFAYSQNYLEFDYRAKKFLDDYIREKKAHFNKREQRELLKSFEKMLDFVEKYFPHGFKKSEHTTKTPKIRFEALSVGAHLALQKKPKLVPAKIDWLDSEAFKLHTRYDTSHSGPKVKARIEYVRNKLLGKKK
jgi:uncharacterized protein YktA (UPF0223 family)